MIDPKELTQSERRALGLIHDYQPARTSGGYGRTLTGKVALAMARRMIERGLARIDHSARGARLMLTGEGLATWQVMDQRKQARAA